MAGKKSRFAEVRIKVDREPGEVKEKEILKTMDMTEDEYYNRLAKVLARDFMRKNKDIQRTGKRSGS